MPEQRLDPEGDALVQHAFHEVEKERLAAVGDLLRLAPWAGSEVEHLIAADMDVGAARVEAHGLPYQLPCELARSRAGGGG